MRFLKPAIAGLMISCAATLSFAADMPAQPNMFTTPPAALSGMNWTGFYVGVNGGYGWGDAITATIDDPVKRKSFSRTSSNPGGFVGGGQLGYNWQTGYWVFGFEADIQYADLGGAIEWTTYNNLNLKNGDGQYFGTIRARLGYAIERSLFYATGGFAYGGLLDNSLSGKSTSNQGFALGGGFEYAFTENWTGRIEGLYVNLESKAKSAAVTVNGAVYNVSTSPTDGAGLFRAGVNYKF